MHPHVRLELIFLLELCAALMAMIPVSVLEMPLVMNVATELRAEHFAAWLAVVSLVLTGGYRRPSLHRFRLVKMEVVHVVFELRFRFEEPRVAVVVADVALEEASRGGWIVVLIEMTGEHSFERVGFVAILALKLPANLHHPID